MPPAHAGESFAPMRIDPQDLRICIEDEVTPYADGAVPTSVPIVQTSLFSFPTLADLQDGLSNEMGTHVYSRGQNPTVEVLEGKVAALERGEACKAFASGMAAVSAVFLGLLKAGDHVVFFNQIYGPTLQLARQLERFGISHDVVLELDVAALEAALLPETRLIWVESPGTMLFRVADLAAVAALARERGITTAIDNTWTTPLLQKPLTLGFDVVMHTATKYLGGHSDVVGGVVVTDRDRMREIFYRAYLLNGGILPPFDAWLLLRGMRTLPARLREHEAAGLAVAEFLKDHPKVVTVHHPAFTANPALVERQMSGYSGVFSFVLQDGSHEAVRRFVDALEIFRIGVSWGGVESLVISPQRSDNAASLARHGLPPGLVRLSVGLEGAEALVADVARALEAV
ncbi:MAG TPA: aminotransferase class I/II-fold pyridoxal phosphate-dependent enzyme [Longimicrobiales bacterium]|nr:aminotransferase class I/II-fold pyridoxal phosphate-dependent enzyme [Longimicrobiales bacterium]